MEAKSELKREFSAGGVVFKKRPRGKPLWLLIQPKAQKQPWRADRWQLPKGLIGKTESSAAAALRETREEGGVGVEIIDKVDAIQIFFYNENKEKVAKKITFYLMEASQEAETGLDKAEVAKITWQPYQKAYQQLTFDSEKKVLKKAKEMLDKGIQERLT